MKHFRMLLGLLLAIVALTSFTSYTAHAASQPKEKLVITFIKSSPSSNTINTHGRSSSRMRPQINSSCVQADEADSGWGTTFNDVGEQLNLNGIFFGANNTCNTDAVNGTWIIVGSGVCPAATTPLDGIVASGSLGFVAANDFKQLFSGTVFIRCVRFDSNGIIIDSIAPTTAGVLFTVRANLNGGTNSASFTDRLLG